MLRFTLSPAVHSTHQALSRFQPRGAWSLAWSLALGLAVTLPGRVTGTGVAQWTIDTFNAANLNGHGAGNKALWCGDNPAGACFVTPPGYGNDWDVASEWRTTVTNPSVAQDVALDFVFNHDTALSDMFVVEYETSAGWTPVMTVGGSNGSGGVFPAPGVHYPDDVAPLTLSYAGNDYAGTNGDEIGIRFRFVSDAAGSDEDGGYPSDGAVQIDDVTVIWDDGNKSPQVSFSDFDNTNDWSLTGPPGLSQSYATTAPGIWIACPAGDGQIHPALATQVSVTLLDDFGSPVAGFPFQDITLESPGAAVAVCLGGGVADANTNALGETSISQLGAGDSTESGMQVYVAGVPLNSPVLPLSINSPDVNGDQQVDISDVSILAADWDAAIVMGQPPSFRSDLYPDQEFNLLDAMLSIPHLGHVCP